MTNLSNSSAPANGLGYQNLTGNFIRTQKWGPTKTNEKAQSKLGQNKAKKVRIYASKIKIPEVQSEAPRHCPSVQFKFSVFLGLCLGMDGEELTEQETALYDRQIRVWGAGAQRRLSKAHVLVCGITGTIAEFCKNIVLAGVGSLTLVDDRVVTEDALSANFLIPSDENVYAGKTLTELCRDSLKDFNPMKLINEKCRKSSKRVAFYTVDCRDSCGEIFVDLQHHKYSKKKNEETIECELHYPSFEESISVPWKSFPRRFSKQYFAMRVIERFEEAEQRKPGELSIADLPAVLKLKKELCEAQSLNESHIPNALLERLVTDTREFPPVCPIIGGILGQEVIKTISEKGDPVKNFFFFDAMDGKGIIEDVSGNP
ncbi:SUMO-activating enzyme subunit 1A isoform X2 [Malus domestica]|uniref:SUMO-activating enzyme subunit 1A isoform X2 n=1 Tax=Malus domestica TaxID=3750 RepID=UPI003976FE55